MPGCGTSIGDELLSNKSKPKGFYSCLIFSTFLVSAQLNPKYDLLFLSSEKLDEPGFLTKRNFLNHDQNLCEIKFLLVFFFPRIFRSLSLEFPRSFFYWFKENQLRKKRLITL